MTINLHLYTSLFLTGLLSFGIVITGVLLLCYWLNKRWYPENRCRDCVYLHKVFASPYSRTYRCDIKRMSLQHPPLECHDYKSSSE